MTYSILDMLNRATLNNNIMYFTFEIPQGVLYEKYSNLKIKDIYKGKE